MKFLALIASFAATAMAQNARLSGEVLDSTGATVPKASLRLVNEGTLAELRVVTVEKGGFVFPTLAPSVYRVSVQANGFKTLVRGGVALDVRTRAELRLVLELGSQADRIEVTKTVAPVYTTSPSVESTVTRDQIQTSPLTYFRQLKLDPCLQTPASDGNY